MSSVIGHCCAAIGIAQWTHEKTVPYPSIAWVLMLCVAACAPDIDYALLILGISLKERVTHSIFIALLFPIAVIFLWPLLRGSRIGLCRASALMLSGLSHLVSDLLVGVTPLPLLWPFTPQKFRLPFGILPSAGGIRLTNPYLYRNLFIELGVILPILAAVFILTTTRRKALAVGCVCLSVPFMIWAACLTR